MANHDAGEVTCPFSGGKAVVRVNAKGKFYFNCPDCGIVQPVLAPFQLWIRKNAALYGADGKPVEKERPAPAETAIPAANVESSDAIPPTQTTVPPATKPAKPRVKVGFLP